MNIEIVRASSFEECIMQIEEKGLEYEVVSERQFVENWIKFWSKTYEVVYKVKGKKVVLQPPMSEAEIFEIIEDKMVEEMIDDKEDSEEKKKILKMLETEIEKEVEDSISLTPEQKKIRDLEKELEKAKNINRVPEKFEKYFELLKSKEIEDVMAKELLKEVAINFEGEKVVKKEVMGSLKNLIGSKIKVTGPMVAEETKVIALVGPTGVGKTTTLAKIGWELHSKGKTVGFITTDTFRSGAKEQLKTIADVMETEVKVAKGSKELKSAIKYFENANQVDHILIDTVGRNPMAEETSEAVKEYLDIAQPDLKCLVMSSTSKVADMKKIIEMFSSVEIDGLVFTKLDETFNPGSIINVFNFTEIPLMYVADGQDITKNLYAPTKEVLLDKILLDEVELKGEAII